MLLNYDIQQQQIFKHNFKTICCNLNKFNNMENRGTHYN